MTKLTGPQQHAWLAKRLNDMHRVFARRVIALHADAGQPDERHESAHEVPAAAATAELIVCDPAHAGVVA